MMRELRFKKIDRSEAGRRDAEVRGLVEAVKNSTPKDQSGITPRSLLKYLLEFNRKASDGLALLDAMLSGELRGPIPPDQQAALLAMRPIFATIVSVCPYKLKKTDDA